MAKVSASCPHCGTAYRVEEALLGKKARCAQCRARFRLARADDRAAVSSSPWPWVSHLPRTTPIGGAAPADSGSEGWRPGDVVLGLYEVRDVFTGGGMGLVYRVRHRGWNVELAVKRPRPEFFRVEQDKDNFEREAETWVKLAPHAHAVACYYVRRVDGIPHVFAEFVDGGSLADWVRDGRLYQGGPDVSLARALDVALQFARGLDHAHQEGLVHRDVKPGNLLMTAAGDAKVTDFGMARALGGTVGASTDALVSAGGLTPAFCSPEQMLGEPVSRATDVWSWGVSVLEMFTGPAAWTAGYLAGDILEDVLRRDPPPGLPRLPPGLVDLLRLCFRRDPAERPRGMAEVAAALRDVYRAATGTPYPRPESPAAEALPDALNNRAVSLLDLNKQDEAEDLWRKALAADPGHPEATYNLGLCRWRGGRLGGEEWVTHLREMGASHPGRWLPAYLLSRALTELGDWGGVIAALEGVGGAAANLDEVRAALALARERADGAGRRVRTYQGHEDWVSSVALAANAGLALSGGADRTLRLWEVATGRCLRVFHGHKDWVTAVALDRDGRRALSGAADGTLRFWDASTGECLKVLEAGGGWVLAVALSADGRRALSAGGGNVALWDLDEGRRLTTLAGHDGPVLAVALSGDGRRALSGGRDGTLRSWDLGRGECRHVFSGHADKVHAVALSEGGNVALSGSADRTLRLWDVEAGHCLRVLTGHEGAVLTAALSSDGAYAVSGGGDRTARYWRLDRGRCLAVLEGHAAGVTAVALDATGRYAVSASGDRTLALWRLPADVRAPYLLARVLPSDTALAEWADYEQALARAWQALAAGDAASAARWVRTARARPGRARQPEAVDRWCGLYARLPRGPLEDGWERHTLEGHLGAVTSVAVGDDGRLALSGSADGTVKIWDVAGGQCLRTLASGGAVVTAVGLGGKSRLAISGGADGFLRLWDVDDGRSPRAWEGHDDVVTAAALNADGRRIVSAGADGAVCLWEAAEGRRLCRLGGHQGPVHAAALCPDGRHVVAGFGQFLLRGDGERLFTSGGLRVWDADSGRCRHDFAGHAEAVTALAISLDGRLVLSGGGGSVFDRHTGKPSLGTGRLHLWERETGRCLTSWAAHVGVVTAVAITGDGRHVFSCGTDRLVKVWDVATGRCLRTFTGHSDAVTCLAAARDGRHLVSGGADQSLRVWLLDWRLEERGPADWDEGARPYLEAFVATRAAAGRRARTEEDFEDLLAMLGWAGYGWLRPDGVRRRLEQGQIV